MDRRTFLRLIGVGGVVLAVWGFTSQPDVRGWRFGVWTITGRYGVRHGQNYYWCRCDCGAERVVSLSQLLSMDALSCDHVRCRALYYINPNAVYCQNCGENRRFFFNGDGMRIWRCGNCEEADIRAYLRRASPGTRPTGQRIRVTSRMLAESVDSGISQRFLGCSLSGTLCRKMRQ